MNFNTVDIFDSNYDQSQESQYHISNLPSVQHYTLLNEICDNFISNLTDQKNFDIESCWEVASPIQPIKIILEPIEVLPGSLDIIKSKNVFINKVLQTFSILGAEIHNLIGEKNYDSLMPLVVYGETTDDTDKIEDGESEIQIARMLPILMEIYENIQKLVPLSLNITNQMHALYNKGFKNYQSSFKNLNFFKPFEYLSKIFAYFNAVDTVYQENKNLQEHWKAYKLMFHRTKGDTTRFGYTEPQAKALERRIRQIDSSILSGKCLNSLIKFIISSSGDQDVQKGNIIPSLFNKEYCSHLALYLKYKSDKLSTDIGSVTETSEKKQLFHLLSLLAYYSKLFEAEPKKGQAEMDKDVFKCSWNILKKICHIPLIAHINFPIPSFFQTIPQLKRFDFQSVIESKKSQLSAIVANFEKLMFNLKLQVMTWITRTNSSTFDIKHKENVGKNHDTRLRYIINGVILANQVKNNLVYCLNTHLNEGVELKGHLISPVCLGLELLKVIELQYNKIQTSLAINYNSILRVLGFEILQILDPIEKKLSSSQNDNMKSDILGAISIIKSNLQANPSKIRMLINELCCDIIKSKQVINSDQIEDLTFHFWRLNILHNLNTEIESTCDTSFFYWYQDIYVDCYNLIIKNPTSIHRLFFFGLALSDTQKQLYYVRHLEDNTSLLKEFKNKVKSVMIDTIFLKLARELENDLRLHMHCILIDELKRPSTGPQPGSIPAQNIGSGIDFIDVLNLRKIRLFEYTISLKLYVQEYLNKIFYDMTAMNLNDWKTYQQMRTLAKSKFGLNLHDVHLPSQTLEQGVDTLYILRNIHKFVVNYYYNLHSQIFIEVTHDNNYLSIIGMQQIINSLNTHGIGIVNSIVNKIYQFLITRLKSLSNVINDEYIKSSLMMEKRYWLDNKESINNQYPFERAEHLMNDIKHYAKVEDTTLVDQIRSYIAQLGNSLGFIRTLKAALTEYQSQSLKFFSKNPIDLIEFINSMSNPDELLKKAGDIFNDTLTLLDMKEKKSTNYLLVLIDSFEDIFTTQNIPDIDLFFYLIPAIMINYIENMIVAKDKLFKKNNKDSVISDDGFILGVAYLLKVFKQEAGFDGLHWFESAISKLENEEKAFGNKKIAESDNLQKKMTLRKVEVYKREFELLFYTYNSAVILFNDY